MVRIGPIKWRPMFSSMPRSSRWFIQADIEFFYRIINPIDSIYGNFFVPRIQIWLRPWQH
jgi:hypothetical protein